MEFVRADLNRNIGCLRESRHLMTRFEIVLLIAYAIFTVIYFACAIPEVIFLIVSAVVFAVILIMDIVDKK